MLVFGHKLPFDWRQETLLRRLHYLLFGTPSLYLPLSVHPFVSPMKWWQAMALSCGLLKKLTITRSTPRTCTLACCHWEQALRASRAVCCSKLPLQAAWVTATNTTAEEIMGNKKNSNARNSLVLVRVASCSICLGCNVVCTNTSGSAGGGGDGAGGGGGGGGGRGGRMEEGVGGEGVAVKGVVVKGAAAGGGGGSGGGGGGGGGGGSNGGGGCRLGST